MRSLRMDFVVTAGNTQTLIDKVRCITNIFTGRTGAALALAAWRRGHRVRLLTSHPEVVGDLALGLAGFPDSRWKVATYQTFGDLRGKLESQLVGQTPDAIFHAAAINDYESVGVYAPAEETRFNAQTQVWQGAPPRLVDRSAGKVKSDEPELWLRLVRTPKLVDLFRSAWGFRGLLVKFKLEVDKTEVELEAIAEASRIHSRADYVVANTLEGAAEWALVGPVAGRYERLTRRDLPERLLDLAEAHPKEVRGR